MPKYNFYEIKGKDVPADLNDPVKKMLLDDLKCPEAVLELLDFQQHKNCGEIAIYYENDTRAVIIKVNWGMAEGYDLVKMYQAGEKRIVPKKHIKNSNLTMKRGEGR
jgi:hypothetical protein